MKNDHQLKTTWTAPRLSVLEHATIDGGVHNTDNENNFFLHSGNWFFFSPSGGV